MKKDEVTVISLDVVNMYPSIKYKVVEKAIKFYAQKLNAEDKNTIKDCLEMIIFRMGNTLFTFRDQ